MQQPHIRLLEHGDKPSAGFVRRPRPVFPEFVSHATWWPVQEWELNGDSDVVYLWIPRADDLAYKKTFARTRYCSQYAGKTCQHGKRHVIIVANAHVA